MDILGFTPSLAWLEQSVPLWTTLVAAFTKPYTWHKQVTKLAERFVDRYFGDD